MWINLLLTALLSAEFIDDDMDGIANNLDQCPQSKLTDIVNAQGCVVEKLHFLKEHTLDLAVGISHYKFKNHSDDVNNFFASYRYDNFRASFYTSTYKSFSGEDSTEDVTFSGSYRFDTPNLLYTLGGGAYYPTKESKGNEVDPFIYVGIRYLHRSFDFNVQLQRTFMQDFKTHDSNSLSLTTGKLLTNQLYTALGYRWQESIYKENRRLRSLFIQSEYFINDTWYVAVDFSKGLNEKAIEYSSSLLLGYTF